ncbi:MAG: hypothetical protein HQM08_18365 [Candidatus Riflebacteria bacterium]|nr:hypothetical protein [Candidatus Riflebacteria bacterium]
MIKSLGREGFLLALAMFLLLGFMAVYPMLTQQFSTAQVRTQYLEEWYRIQWALEGANQKQLQAASTKTEPFSGYTSSTVSFDYPGSFSVKVTILEGRTLLARDRFLNATAVAYRNGVDAGYNLSGFTPLIVSIPGIAAGGLFSFGWKKNGYLFAWGYNGYGQLGLSNTSTTSSPSQVLTGDCPSLVPPFFTKAWNISAGSNHSLATDYSGNVWAWGRNNNGQIGQNPSSMTSSSLPIAVFYSGFQLTGISDIFAGGEFSLALENTTGKVYAWGSNSKGQIGVNSWFGSFYGPNVVRDTTGASNTSLKNIVGIAAGKEHALAIDTAGGIYAWGDNTYGEIGLGNNSNYFYPCKINSGLATAVASITYVPTGTSKSIVNSSGPAVTQFYLPASYTVASFSVTMNISSADTFYTPTIQITKPDSSLTYITPNTFNQTSDPYVWQYQRSTSSIQFDSPGTYTIKVYERLIIFGNLKDLKDHWYQTNTKGVFEFIGSPNLPNGYIGIAAGGYFSSAIASQATQTLLYTWGQNNKGQLGQGDSMDRSTPALIKIFNQFRTVSAGLQHMLALKNDGTVYAWGDNSSGQLGLADQPSPISTWVATNTPVLVKGALVGKNIIGIAAGDTHSMAIDDDGYVYAWGSRSNGQIGDSSFSGIQGYPKQISGFP